MAGQSTFFTDAKRVAWPAVVAVVSGPVDLRICRVDQYPLAEGETMGVFSLLRKGFGYVLLSMGVSSPDAAKKKPAAKPEPKPEPRP